MLFESVTFDIFEPAPKKFRISRNLIGLVMTIALLIWSFLTDKSEDWLFGLFVFVYFFTLLYFLFSSVALRKPLHGKFDGEVEFTHDAIIFKGSPYYLSEISAIDFSVDDYYNKYMFFPSKTLNQRRSQGVNNYVEFTVMHKESYIIYLRCEDEDHHRLLDPFIGECVRLNKKRRIA